MGEFITFPPMIIAPSLLAANFGRLAAETTRIAKAKADWLHLDIMDGHFVENISFGPAVVKVLRPLTKMDFDVHLMCSRPEILLNPFAEAGPDHLIIPVVLAEPPHSRILRLKALALKTA